MRTVSLATVVAVLLGIPVAALAGQAGRGAVYKPGDGVTAPVVVREVKPQYTADAMTAKIQGTVRVECVVETNGKIGDVKIIKSLDPGLDQEAVKAVKRWTFKPGKKDGKAVRVRIELELTFTLR